MVTSFAAEHEEMYQLLSNVTKECVEIKDKYVELDIKFKEYYMRSDVHIKQQAADLQAVKTELATMKHRHKNYESLFKAETERGEKFEKLYKDIQAPF